MAPKRHPSSPATKPPTSAAAAPPPPTKPTPPQPTPSRTTTTSSSSSTTPTPSTRAPKSSSSSSTSSPSTKTTLSAQSSALDIFQGVWNTYVARTPQRVKLLDTFMAFLVVVGVLQFVYCVVGGNYPFNAFLSGFSATVGQFVLTASLRMQTNVENRVEFKAMSHERAFADYVFGSLILHLFCVNFIN